MCESRQCPVCFENFADEEQWTPLLLSCGHTVCRRCLSALVSSSSAAAAAVQCPVCRTPTALGDAGVAALPKNFTLIAMLADHQQQQKQSNICEECQKEPATTFCAECRVQYCAACDECVHRFAATRKHTRVPVAQRAAVDEPRCPLHGKKLHFFCADCRALCCALCREGSAPGHRGHSVQLRTDAAADVERGFADDAARLQACTAAPQPVVDALLAKAAAELRESQELVAEQIAREFAAVRAALDAREQALRAQLQDGVEPALKTLEAQHDAVAGAVAGARATLSAVEPLLGQRPDSVAKLNAAVDAWRSVRAAIADVERCAEFVVDAKKAVFRGSAAPLCASVANFAAVTITSNRHSLPTESSAARHRCSPKRVVTAAAAAPSVLDALWSSREAVRLVLPTTRAPVPVSFGSPDQLVGKRVCMALRPLPGPLLGSVYTVIEEPGNVFKLPVYLHEATHSLLQLAVAPAGLPQNICGTVVDVSTATARSGGRFGVAAGTPLHFVRLRPCL